MFSGQKEAIVDLITMLCKYGKHVHNFLGVFVLIFISLFLVVYSLIWVVHKKTIVPLALLVYETMIANLHHEPQLLNVSCNCSDSCLDFIFMNVSLVA